MQRLDGNKSLLKSLGHAHGGITIFALRSDGISNEPEYWKDDGALCNPSNRCLAIMILCGASDTLHTFTRIDQSEFLGPVDEDEFRQSLQKHGGTMAIIDHDLQDSCGQLIGGVVPRANHSFGFMLPHGIGEVNYYTFSRAARAFNQAFNAVEEVTRTESGIAKDVI